MNRRLFKTALFLALLAAPAGAVASDDGNGSSKIAVHGSVQSDILFPQEDKTIGTGTYDDKLLTNTYADVGLYSRKIDAGLRLEFLKWPLPGFESDFQGWGVPNVYVTGRFGKWEITGGTFYEQFGSGFILRTYEERSLGIDNSILGSRVRYTPFKALKLTALGGVQRRYWDWETRSSIYGANAELAVDELFKSLRDRNISWNFGASYVLKHEDSETVLVPGTNMALRLPRNVSAFDLRSRWQRGAWGLTAEYAWKSQDPSFDNSYTYGRGQAVMLSGAYSRSGLSALLQIKRSENMAFRSQRSMSGISAFINNLPAFTYQQTYSLAALYPYATQAAPGEWAIQGSFGYTFKRKTALGGRYGTKVRLNGSWIRGLDHNAIQPVFGNSAFGTDGGTKFFGLGEGYYHDVNMTVEKKVSKPLQFTFMYMNQLYNKTIIEGHGGRIRTNIFVAEAKYKMTNRLTGRMELQYLTTRQDQKDWAYGLLELSVAPYLMFTLSDMWNCGDTKTHYYMGAITGNYKSNRLMLSFGRTRAGYNCSGGVCRYVPAVKGFQIAYSYNF